MAAPPLDRLSEGQRQCLRLVFRHYSAKQIAREIGLTEDGVVKRIKAAMAILGVSSRFEAARILIEHEDADLYQRLVGPPMAVADDDGPPPFNTSQPGHGTFEAGLALREERAVFDAHIDPRFGPAGPRQSPPPHQGEDRRHDLNIWMRLAWVIAIAIGSALAFGAVLAGLDALERLT